jgi:hypothetical protein
MLYSPVLNIPQTTVSELLYPFYLVAGSDVFYTQKVYWWLISVIVTDLETNSRRKAFHRYIIIYLQCLIQMVFLTVSVNLMSFTRISIGARAQGSRLHVLFMASFSGLRDFVSLTELYGDKMPSLVVWKFTFKRSNFSFNTRRAMWSLPANRWRAQTKNAPIV